MTTMYANTGAHGTITQPWAGDTYTVLDTASGAIAGWVVYHSGTWRPVPTTVCADLQAAYALLDSISPDIRRDSFHDAWMAVERARGTR